MAKEAKASSAAKRNGLTQEAVVDAAMEILVKEDLPALSMRRLAAELGVGAPTIYWHVGNRRQLLELLIERISGEFGAIRPEGSDPTERIVYICTRLLREVQGKPQLIALAVECGAADEGAGRGEAIFLEAQQLLARELSAAGFSGREAAFALSTILSLLGGFILLEHSITEHFRVEGARQWHSDDEELNTSLREGVEVDEMFAYSLRAVVDGLLADRRS